MLFSIEFIFDRVVHSSDTTVSQPSRLLVLLRISVYLSLVVLHLARIGNGYLFKNIPANTHLTVF